VVDLSESFGEKSARSPEDHEAESTDTAASAGHQHQPVDVATVMGHRSTTTTWTFYAHRIPRDMGYIANTLTAARERH